MKQLKAKILENKEIARSFYKMRVESAYLAKNTKPGQFFEIRCSAANEPLLRRPLGAHRILKNGVEMLYEVVGKGTELLSKRKAGNHLDIIGPLGNGFTYDSMTLRPYAPILVAGGVGVAPLVALAERLRKNRHKVIVIIGAKTKSRIMCEEEFKSLGCEVSIATEDGSKGHKGLATDLLRMTNDACPPKPRGRRRKRRTTIYACGPAAMLKAVAKIAEARRMPCQVSLEERMACGVGVCLGCPVKVRTAYSVQCTVSTQYAQRSTQYEYKMVCKDGPVFDAREIAW